MLQKNNKNRSFYDNDNLGNLDIGDYLIESIQKDPFVYQPIFKLNNDNKSDQIFIDKQAQKFPQSTYKQISIKRFKVIQNVQNQSDNILEIEINNQLEQELFIQKKDKLSMDKDKIYAKNYRQRKKQEMKSLQQQNRFLKQKIQDLSFRLKQTQIQLSKLKNKKFQEINFQDRKQKYLNQIQNAIKNDNIDVKEILQIEQKYRSLSAFSSKHRMDLLSYFMSELLQNLINDVYFYFLDSILQKKGLFRQSQQVPYRKIDEQILTFFSQSELNRFKNQLTPINDYLCKLMISFKGLWKKLYQDYIQIINQGSMIQALRQPMQKKLRQHNIRLQVINALKFELYFEKIKYRKDMRLLRKSWFQQLQTQKYNQQSQKNIKKIKKIN